MNTLVSRFLQDNGALLRNSATGSPVSITMATRIASPSPDRLSAYLARQSDFGPEMASPFLRRSGHQDSSLSAASRSTIPQEAYLGRPDLQRHSSTTTTTTTTTNPNPYFGHSTPPNASGRFRRSDQNSTGLIFDLWDDDNGEAPVNHDFDSGLLDFLETNFSSPSTYPSFLNTDQTPPAGGLGSRLAPQAQVPVPESPPLPRRTAPRNQNDPSGACILHASAPERSETQLTTSTTTTVGESQNTLFNLDEYGDLFDTPASSFDEIMPPLLRRRPQAVTPPADAGHRSKRRRTLTNVATPTLRKTPSSRAYATEVKIDDEDDCIFEEKHARATPGRGPKIEDLTTIDLTEANEVPEELRKPQVDNRIKISSFQCVICMDDCTNLTVTHCGHMYCAQCLHSSLNVEATRGKCPMCRQKLELKPRENYNSKTKGYWPLELKLMTATRKGKRKANSMA